MWAVLCVDEVPSPCAGVRGPYPARAGRVGHPVQCGTVRPAHHPGVVLWGRRGCRQRAGVRDQGRGAGASAAGEVRTHTYTQGI